MALAATLVALAQPVTAQDEQRPAPQARDQQLGAISGHTYRETAPISGRLVRLPAGSWTVIAHLPIRTREGDRLDSAMLARIDGSAVVGMVLLVSSDPRRPTIKDRRDATGCDRSDLYQSRAFVSRDRSTEGCMRMTYSQPHDWEEAPNLIPIFQEAVAELARRHIALPEVLVQVGFDMWTRTQMLTTVYYFNPATEGITPPPGSDGRAPEWQKYEVDKSPRRAAYVERVKAWGTRWWPIMRASFASGRKATDATLATHEKEWP